MLLLIGVAVLLALGRAAHLLVRGRRQRSSGGATACALPSPGRPAHCGDGTQEPAA
ncbi:MAG TPA: hypothetical protein VFA46_03530 [Actinomycetes bacterium]|nr:hypothetical protein [Actinomycetes bacterium]